MDTEIPENYQLETIDQMRAMSDDLRLRILQLLGHAAMTVTELGKQLDVPANKTHYHVRELERVGLLRLVETREKGGILEKYYRAVAHDFTVPGSLLRGVADEGLALIDEIVQGAARGINHAIRIALAHPDDLRESLAVGSSYIWLTRDEHRDLIKHVTDLLDPYTQPRDLPDAREHTFTLISYPTPPLAGEAETPPADAAPRDKKHSRTIFTAGATGYSRADLEHAVAADERMDIHALGLVTFADDIPADLVERAIGRFRHRGKLIASPEVRAVLARKAERKEPPRTIARPAQIAPIRRPIDPQE